MKQMNTKLQDETFDAIKIRFHNPFIFSFSLSFLIINWKFIFLLISSKGEATQIISIADSLLKIESSLYYPLATSLIYTFIWPWASYLVDSYIENIKLRSKLSESNRNHTVKINNIENQHKEIQFETRENELMEKLIKARGSTKDTIDHYKEMISSIELLQEKAKSYINKDNEDYLRIRAFREILVDMDYKIKIYADKNHVDYILKNFESYGRYIPSIEDTLDDIEDHIKIVRKRLLEEISTDGIALNTSTEQVAPVSTNP